MATVSAPGKVHLIGEYAIIYNEPAIIAAIGLRTTVKAEKSGSVRYKDRRFGHDDSWPVADAKEASQKTLALWETCMAKKDFSVLFAGIKAGNYENYKKTVIGIALSRLGIDGGISISVNSDVPGGAGLGSSSSLAVCIAKAAAEEYKKPASPDEINSIAYEMEKIIHGTPSGGDNAACCYGGLIWFKKAKKNIIEQVSLPYRLENFVMVYTKKPEKTTGELVQMVRNLEENYRNKRVKAIGRLAFEMLDALKTRNFTRMKEIINEDQMLLAELGVSIPEIDEIHDAVRRIGGAAKLCGAGGGGVMLCYHEDKAKLVKTITALGYKPLEADLGVEGVRVEK